MYGVSVKFLNGELNCDCPDRCKYVNYLLLYSSQPSTFYGIRLNYVKLCLLTVSYYTHAHVHTYTHTHPALQVFTTVFKKFNAMLIGGGKEQTSTKMMHDAVMKLCRMQQTLDLQSWWLFEVTLCSERDAFLIITNFNVIQLCHVRGEHSVLRMFY